MFIIHHGYIFLLELRPEILNQLEDIRYNVFGCNGSYYGGEVDSWQRYTSKLPIHSKRVINYVNNTFSVSISPEIPLRPNIWYAVVLLHSPIRYKNPNIFEDYLIPFLPNDCSHCQNAIFTFLIYMRTKGEFMYSVGKIVSKYYVWPTQFDLNLWYLVKLIQ